ncbi:MAG: peptidylprolyl isomerase [Polyangiaceae bacterium]|nr:peptidylprolyl isomerase [Polyangiaceae bacterium]
MSAVSSAPIAADTHVTIRYFILEEAVGKDGAIGWEEAPEEEPVTVSYVHGYGQVLPAIEIALLGKSAGDHLSFTAGPEDAFGPHEAAGVFEIDKDGLDGAADLSAGEEVVATGPDGEIFMRIVEVREASLLVDTNHPLAGKNLKFELDVLEVRPATEGEIEEAQADLEDGGCGCGHDHSGDDHDHGHDHEQALIQLTVPSNSKVS